eukprot:jgi/Psemu1/11631/gm1.11631_g
MTASQRHNKRQTKSPSDVASQVTILDNDSQAAGTKNHDVPPPVKKSCKSPLPSNAVSTVITQPDFPDEASETAARTNKVPAVLTQVETFSGESFETATRTNAEVGVQALPEDDSPAAGTKNGLPPHQRRVAPEYISQDDDVPEEASKTAARTNEVPAVLNQEVLGSVSDEFSDATQKLNAEVGNLHLFI